MESRFLTPLDARCLEDDRTWELLAPLTYQSKLLGRTLTVPAGYKTDFASVPRVPIAYGIWGDKAHHESVPHDWCYATHCVTKEVADSVFLEAMTIRKKPFYIRWPMYLAVKFGGASSYANGPSKFKAQNPDLAIPANFGLSIV